MDTKIKVYRAVNGIETVVANIANDNSILSESIMAKNEVSVSVVIDSIFDLKEKDYIHIGDVKYKLNRTPEFTDKSDVEHEYHIIFEHPIYTLLDKILTNRITGSTKVVLTGTLRDWIELLVWNLNKTADNPLGVDTGWTVGNIPDTEYMNLVFDGVDCRTVLNKLASAYGLEYYVPDHDIHFISRIENVRDLTFTQGRGNGLYKVEQQNVDEGDVITRIFPRGGSDNVVPGEGDEEGRLMLPEKYLENFEDTDRVVEKKVVFDKIHPTFTGQVENPAGENNRIFTCPAINFNAGELAIGDEGRVNFLTGDLMGKSFEFEWNDSTKQITLIYQEDDMSAIDPETQTRPNIPSSIKYLRGGEKFNFTGIRLPVEYKNAAIERLRSKSAEWLGYNSRKRVKYSLDVDYRYMRGKGNLKPGDLITINIPSRNISTLIRVTSVDCNLKSGKLTCVVSNYLDEKWKDKIEGQISSIESSINSSGNMGTGNKVDIIERLDARQPSDKNVFSALRSLDEFHPKGGNYTAEFLAKNISVGSPADNVSLSYQTENIPGNPEAHPVIKSSSTDLYFLAKNKIVASVKHDTNTGEGFLTVVSSPGTDNSQAVVGVELRSAGLSTFKFGINVGNFVAGTSGASIVANGDAQFGQLVGRNKVAAYNKERNNILSLDFAPAFLPGDNNPYPFLYTDFPNLYFSARHAYSAVLDNNAENGEQSFWLNNAKPDVAATEAGRIKLNTNSLSHIKSGLIIGEAEFVDGLNGASSRIDSSGNAAFNNLTVRGGITANEFITNQVRASNGSRVESDCVFLGASPYTYDGLNGFEWFNTIKGQELGFGFAVPFEAGDVLNFRRVVADAGGVKKVVDYYTQVISVTRTPSSHAKPNMSYITTGWVFPSKADYWAGTNPIKIFPFYGDNDTWVRVDNRTNQKRRGWINLNASPYFGESPQISCEVGISGYNNGGSVAQMGKLTLDSASNYYGFMLKSPGAGWRDSVFFSLLQF